MRIGAYLYGGALIREGWVEEGGDHVHDGFRHVVLQRHVRVLTVMRRITHLSIKEEATLQC